MIFKLVIFLTVLMYITLQARDDCREDEKDIADMQAPLNEMKEQAQAELDKVGYQYGTM